MKKTQSTFNGRSNPTLPAAAALGMVVLLFAQGDLFAGGNKYYCSPPYYGRPVYCPPPPPVCYVPPPVYYRPVPVFTPPVFYYTPRSYRMFYGSGYYSGCSGYRGSGSISFTFWR